MLKKKTKETIDTTLTINGQGETIKLPVVYHNRSQKDYDAFVDTMASGADLVLFLIASWEAEYELSLDGLQEAEGDFPGLIMALVQGWRQARTVGLTKN